jgi:hypothetical protein
MRARFAGVDRLQADDIARTIAFVDRPAHGGQRGADPPTQQQQ